MKNNNNVALLAMFAAALVVIGVLLVRMDQQQAAQVQAIRAAQDSTHHWQDRYGREHADRMLIQGNSATINALKGELLDSVSRALRVLKKNIESISTAGVVTQGSVTPNVYNTYVNGDTNKKALGFNYKDKWLKLDGLLSDTPYVKYEVYDSLVFSMYHKRKGLFKKTMYLDAYSLNPNSHITGITGVRVKGAKAGRFGVGPYIGYGYNGQSWQPNAGVSIHYSLIRF